MNWVQPDSERLRAALPGLFGALTRHHYLAARGAEIATSDAGVGAAALWDPPGRWGQSSREQIAMLPAVLRAFRGRLAVGRTVTELMKAQHPEEPHWYLPLIGVDPRFQGRGVGSLLMKHALAVCDREGAAAYLESSNPMNIPFYERHGFDILGEIQHGDSPIVAPMLRKPRKGG